MFEPDTLRMLERIVVTIFGGTSLFLGYLLFRHGIVLTQTGEVKLLDSFHFKATRVGPGIFFAFFGCAVLVTSLVQSVQYSRNGTVGSTSFAGHTPRQGIRPEACIASINSVRADIEDHVEDYFKTDYGRQVDAGLARVREHMLFDAFVRNRDLVLRYLKSVAVGDSLEIIALDNRELEVLIRIETAATGTVK